MLSTWLSATTMKAVQRSVCNNHESGAKVRKECKVGCIGCKICEVKVPSSGCKVTSFLSSIDYSADHSNIAQAAELCPQKCIVKKD